MIRTLFLWTLLLTQNGCGQDPAAPTGSASSKLITSESAVIEPGTNDSTTSTSAASAEIEPTERPGSDWAKFLGPNGDGSSPETGVDAALWDPHPPILWTTSLGVSYGAPAVVGNRVLQFDRFDDAERLTCYSARTGQEAWRLETPIEYDDMYGYNNGPRCSPIVEDNLVYTYGVAGQLSCVRLTDGKLMWTKNLLDEYSVIQNFFGVASTPVIHNDLILVMVGGSPNDARDLPLGRLDLVQPNGTGVVAFDRLTGKERYRVANDLASYASMTVREIDGQPVGLAFLRSGLTAFDPASGTELFRFPWRANLLESVNAAVPVTVGDQILLSETYEIGSVLIEIDDNKPRVVRKDTGPRRNLSFRAHWSTPVVIDGYLYGCSGRNQPDSDFRCVRFSDGDVQWSDRRHERSSVLAVDGYLIVLGEYGKLELIHPNPEKLEVVAEVDLSDIADETGSPILSYPCWAAPVLSRGRLFLRGNDRLICMDLIPSSPKNDSTNRASSTENDN